MRRKIEWRAHYDAHITDADDAVALISSGQRVLVGSGCAAPNVLLEAMLERHDELEDVELVHLLTFGIPPYTDERYDGVFRHNAFFIGANTREAVRGGRADYTPIFLSEIPGLFSTGKMSIDVALVMVSPPNRFGYCSLGIHPDIIMTGVDNARIVIAQVNEQMPEVAGDTYVHVTQIDRFVLHDAPLAEIPLPGSDDVSSRISRHVAGLIEDGATLQLGIGRIPNEVSHLLTEHNDLGLHTEMFSDSIIPLVESGVITNRKKGFMERKAIASFAMGSQHLYDFLDNNPYFEFHRTEFVNDPRVICRNRRMTSINAAIEVDLTGQVAADSIGSRFYSGIGGQVDFIRGAAMSEGGKPIIVLPSTASKGQVSRIVPTLSEGAGVVTSRGDVHYIVSEYGVAYLHGLSIRQRAERLIEIAHPDFRPELRAAAQKKRYFPPLQRPAPKPESIQQRYAEEVDTKEVPVHLRPLTIDDWPRLQAFSRTHTEETMRARYGDVRRSLSDAEARHLCDLDQRLRFAVAGFAGEGAEEQIVAVGRYEGNPTTHFVDVHIVIGESWRRRGLGTELWKLLTQRASEFGFAGATATFSLSNAGARAFQRSLGLPMRIDDGECICKVLFNQMDTPTTSEDRLEKIRT